MWGIEGNWHAQFEKGRNTGVIMVIMVIMLIIFMWGIFSVAEMG